MLKECTKFNGEHKGIPYEIIRFAPFEHMRESGSMFSWCHYIFVYDTQFKSKPKLPESYFTEFGTCLTSTPDWVHNIEFHGGCTYCEIHNTDHLGNLLKIGCDYQHYWDEGKNYQLEYVRSKAIASVESLLELYPDLITMEELSKRFRSNFPGEKYDNRKFGRFDANGNELNL